MPNCTRYSSPAWAGNSSQAWGAAGQWVAGVRFTTFQVLTKRHQKKKTVTSGTDKIEVGNGKIIQHLLCPWASYWLWPTCWWWWWWTIRSMTCPWTCSGRRWLRRRQASGNMIESWQKQEAGRSMTKSWQKQADTDQWPNPGGIRQTLIKDCHLRWSNSYRLLLLKKVWLWPNLFHDMARAWVEYCSCIGNSLRNVSSLLLCNTNWVVVIFTIQQQHYHQQQQRQHLQYIE